jgi:hypothetical protein
MNPMRAAAVVLAGVMASCASTPPPPPAKPAAPIAAASDLETLISWLPADTETLMVARGPIRIEASLPGQDDEDDVGDLSLERVVESLVMGSLSGIRKGQFYNLLAGHAVALALEGSRKFRPPTRLGSFLYEGCSIFLMESGAALDIAMRALESEAEETYHDRGTRVSLFREQWEEDVWTLLVARPRPNVLLCATNAGFLSEVLERIAKPAATRAFPRELPEWKLLEPTAKAWAMRHYIRGDEDAYSDSFQGDETAIGMVFYPAADGRSGRLRFISQNEKSLAEVNGAFHNPREGLRSKVTHEDGIIEVVASCGEVRALSFFVLVLLGYLGHGVFI